MASDRKGRLSKSRLMRGLQCPKSLYLTVHHPELEPPASPAQQALFDQGHEVGAAAQKEYPAGIAITAPYYDTAAAVGETEKAIQNGVCTIFEAAFATTTLTAKIDILHRETPASPWQLIEVKSSTSVQPEHIDDVAIQAHVIRESGGEVDRAFVAHINNQTTAPELKDLFRRVDVTAEVQRAEGELPTKISALQEMLSRSTPPETPIGPHCSEPYGCPFTTHCWKHVPPASVFELPSIGAKAWELYAAGIIEIADPRFIPSPGLQACRVEAVRTGTRWVDSAAIAEALNSWRWPLYYLDFETISFAIPRYPGTRPYQQVPFQFSCLIQDAVGGPVREEFYLHEDLTDPRPALTEALVSAFDGEGSIVAYNMGFEASCLKALAAAFPQYAESLQEATGRLVDPLPIFRSCVYDKGFSGSFSIKSVAPVILGKERSYDGMLVSDGEAAQRAFLQLIDGSVGEEAKRELRQAMLDYCRKDTIEMRDLVDWLLAQAETKSDGKLRARKRS